MRLVRNALVALIFIASLPMAIAPARAADYADDVAMGDSKAPVTVIEYASVGCPHCAVWANTVFPAFKAKWIDTGKVRFVLREMLTGQTSLAAAGFLTARCSGPGHYFAVVDAIFRVQEAIFADGDALSRLSVIARDAGLSPERLTACLNDKGALAALEARSERNGEDVTGTPTFVIGRQKLLGDQSVAALGEAIVAATGR